MDDEEFTEEEREVIAAIREMAREKYPCTITDHDPDDDEFLVEWKDAAGHEWACWFTRRFINEVFTEVVLN